VNAKTDVRYWQERVFKPRSVRGGGMVVVELSSYHVRFMHASKRLALNLHTANRREAAERARERYQFLIANGWERSLAKYQAAEQRASEGPAKTILTVGDYLEAVRGQSELSPVTIESYAKPFRSIVADIMHIRGTKKRFDYRAGGHQKWLAQVHAVSLANITSDKIRAWKRKRIAGAKDEIARRRITVSTNSILRRARALFSRRNVLQHLQGLPAPLPFDGLSIERITSKFHGCGVEPRELLRAAMEELGEKEPETLKAFLLSLTLGLRRREVDLLEWQSFDFQSATLRILPTRWYQLKTAESAASLPLEPEILALFRAWKAKATGPFVVESERKPKAVTYQWYRCQPVFDSLLAWLRAKGVQGNKPLHALRKLYGSMLAELHGIHVAAAGLRHADIRTTSEFYADRTLKLTPGFGSVLSGALIESFPSPVASPRKQAQS